MSARIRKLSGELVNKISAGEVVVSPASVIKELVENSIDAGAKRISVEIENGGKSLIRVTDNGSGIERDQIELAFDRNATSKIDSLEKLNEIDTLGFRGEALFSISVVSLVSIRTKSEEESTGSFAEISDGKVKSLKAVAFNRGTQIEVKDLFYNTPARRKHMKSDRGERINSIDIVSKLAVANPDVAFSLKSDSREVFITSGDGNIRNALISVMGEEYVSGMVEVSFEDVPVKVCGYTLSPNYLDRKMEESILVINGRYVKNDRLNRAITEIYREQFGLFSRRISYVLYITLPYSFTDVNIHPSKTTISFRNETLVTMLICEGIRNAVKSEIAVKENPAGIRKKEEEPVQLVFENTEEFAEAPKKSVAESISDDGWLADSFADYTVPSSKGAVREDTIGPDDFSMRGEERKAEVRKPEGDKIDRSAIRRIAKMEFAGTLFRAYAVFENRDTLYIVDTHAAHERVLYDSYLKEFESGNVGRQTLLAPLVIDLGHVLKDTVLQGLDTFTKMGYEIEDFSGSSIIVREIPEMFSLDSAKKTVIEIAEKMRMTGITEGLNERNEQLISTACHNAVRGKDRISREEAVRLLEMLSETDNPFSCPHSRPTVSRIEKKYFEKMFQRL